MDDSACEGQVPEREKHCELRPCEGLDWVVSEWSGVTSIARLLDLNYIVRPSLYHLSIVPHSATTNVISLKRRERLIAPLRTAPCIRTTNAIPIRDQNWSGSAKIFKIASTVGTRRNGAR